MWRLKPGGIADSTALRTSQDLRMCSPVGDMDGTERAGLDAHSALRGSVEARSLAELACTRAGALGRSRREGMADRQRPGAHKSLRRSLKGRPGARSSMLTVL